MSENTTNEILKKYMEVMGQELGEVFYELEKEVILVHQKWMCYKELFAENEDQIKTLNICAGPFFYLIQIGLIENVIMSIARITDPSKTGKYNNLTIKKIADLISDKKLKKEIDLQIDWIIDKSVDFARTIRMKKFAHKDYDVSLNRAALDEKALIENIQLALDSIKNFFNSVHNHFFNSKTLYEHDAFRGSGKQLVNCLRDSLILRSYVKKLRANQESIPEELINFGEI